MSNSAPTDSPRATAGSRVTAAEVTAADVDDAAERLDEAQRYLTERVQEKPVQSTFIALGVGVVLGLLLAGRRH